MWKNKSFEPPQSMNPKPLSVNFLIVPSAILSKSLNKSSLQRHPTQIRLQNTLLQSYPYPRAIVGYVNEKKGGGPNLAHLATQMSDGTLRG